MMTLVELFMSKTAPEKTCRLHSGLTGRSAVFLKRRTISSIGLLYFLSMALIPWLRPTYSTSLSRPRGWGVVLDHTSFDKGRRSTELAPGICTISNSMQPPWADWTESEDVPWESAKFLPDRYYCSPFKEESKDLLTLDTKDILTIHHTNQYSLEEGQYLFARVHEGTERWRIHFLRNNQD